MPWILSYSPLAMKSLMSSVALAESHCVCDAVGGRQDLDVRVLGERLLEAHVAVGVGRVAGDAAHVVDVALAAQLLEQPLGAEVRVLDLVVVEVVGVRVGDVGVDRDGHDAGGLRLLERRVEGVGVVRVEDDRVDALRDQVTDVAGAGPRRPRCGGSTVSVATLPDASASRLGGADLLLAEAVADAAAVRVPDRSTSSLRAAAAGADDDRESREADAEPCHASIACRTFTPPRAPAPSVWASGQHRSHVLGTTSGSVVVHTSCWLPAPAAG